jgi:hypothetical protein
LVLCVDAGGTSCKAVIASKDGDMGIGTSGPCNVLVSRFLTMTQCAPRLTLAGRISASMPPSPPSPQQSKGQSTPARPQRGSSAILSSCQLPGSAWPATVGRLCVRALTSPSLSFSVSHWAHG